MEKSVETILSVKNPVFSNYIFYSSILIVKMLLMSIMSSIQRHRKKVFSIEVEWRYFLPIDWHGIVLWIHAQCIFNHVKVEKCKTVCKCFKKTSEFESERPRYVEINTLNNGASRHRPICRGNVYIWWYSSIHCFFVVNFETDTPCNQYYLIDCGSTELPFRSRIDRIFSFPIFIFPFVSLINWYK